MSSSALLAALHKRRATKLSNLKVREISLVDEGAGGDGTPDGSCDIILTKARRPGGYAINFEPVLIHKARDAEGYDDEGYDEDGFDRDGNPRPDEDDDTEDDDVDKRNAAARAESLMKVRQAVEQRFGIRFGKVGRNGGASHSASDRSTVRDNRTAAQKSADMAAVVKGATATPPVASERLDDWMSRAYGDQLDLLDHGERVVIAKIFDAFKQGVELRKRADDAITSIAKSLHEANPSRGFQSCWAQAARDNPQLYNAMRRAEQHPLGGGNTVAKMSPAEAAAYYQPELVGDARGFGNAGYAETSSSFGDEAGDAMAYLNRTGADIRKSNLKLSPEQAFAEACRQFPDVYKRCRGMQYAP